MNQKILFFDIDGTLLTQDTNMVPQSTTNALKKARKKGHLVFINTGRPYSIIDSNLHDIGFDGYVCGCGTYIKTGEKILLSRTINPIVCNEIISLLRKCNIEAVLEGTEDIYFDNREDLPAKVKKMKNKFGKRGFGITKDWNTKGLIFDKFFCMFHEDSDKETFLAYINKEFQVIDRGNNCAEIIPKGYSKATGIEMLLKYHQIPLENVFAFGDSANDLEMLEYVPNSIAMGESTQSVYDIASFITKDIHEDGIEYALKHFGII